MTEGKVFALILAGSMLLTAMAVLGLAVIGVRGPALSLGAIVPMVLGAHAIGLMVVHYGGSERSRR